MARDRSATALENFTKYIDHLASGAIKNIGKQQLRSVVGRVKKMVQAKYRDESGKGSKSSWVQRTYSAGKEKGAVRPERIPRPGSVMQELADNVIIQEIGDGFVVRVDPSLVSPYRMDAPLALVADWIENGTEMLDTWRSMIYRIMMQENRGGYGTRRREGVWGQAHLPDGPSPTAAVHVMKPRPVWKPVAESLVKTELMTRYPDEIRRRMAAVAVAFGAEIVEVSG